MPDAPPIPQPVLPPELPVLPLRRQVVLPLTVQPLAIDDMNAIDSVNRALATDRMLLVLYHEAATDEPSIDDLKRIGTVAVVRQMTKGGTGLRLLVEGVARARAEFITPGSPAAGGAPAGGALRALVKPLPEYVERTLEVDAHLRRIHELVDRTFALSTGLSPDVRALLLGIDDPLRLCYVLASLLDMKPGDKQTLLEVDALPVKLTAVADALTREIALLEMKGKIESRAQQEMTDAQRKYFLREQLRAIQQELGEGPGGESDDVRRRIADAKLPAHVAEVADREIARLDRMSPASPDYQMIRTYLDWLLDVPWSVATADRLDPIEARKVLDEDHYDLDKVKERIVEYLAVRKLKGDLKGPILCFVGPPGVGKTSLGQSIARAMNRAFVRLSLGGVRDEAEIRGHRRTYIGSMPGRLVQALRQAAAINPVCMLDEIDKLTVGFQGDPASALLEVLDPAQNHAFRDHYLEVPIDLSRVLFIATANQLGPVQAALLDRMEVISLSGYSEEEKVHIARRYLIPRQVAEHGLAPAAMDLTEAALRRVIAEYTREAGVRHLERQVGTIARKIAARVATAMASGAAASDQPAVRVDAPDVPAYLGPPRFRPEAQFRTSRPGVATGVAWTESGGDVLFIEASLLPGGNGQIILTGQLGNVMQESARAAVSHIRAQAPALGIRPDFLGRHDLHVHVPAGAIPKDGPSAGVTMAIAIVSALRNQPVREDVAMTGEITLSGLVLPVGGIREKALAARRHGISTFILPQLNEPDLAELPPELLQNMTFVPVRTLDDALALALPRSGDAMRDDMELPSSEIPAPRL